jgi:hypothetical protein
MFSAGEGAGAGEAGEGEVFGGEVIGVLQVLMPVLYYKIEAKGEAFAGGIPAKRGALPAAPRPNRYVILNVSFILALSGAGLCHG